MLDKFQWLINGINLYLDNGARYFQPIAMFIRLPVYLLAGLAIFVCSYSIFHSHLTESQMLWTTFGLACAIGWFGSRVVFKFPPDDTGSV